MGIGVDMIPFLIQFILPVLTGKFFLSIYIGILTTITFCIVHTNLGNWKKLQILFALKIS